MKTKLLKHFSLRATMLVLMVLAAVNGAWADTFTFVPSSKEAGTLSSAPSGVTATFANTYNNANQMTKGNSMTLTLKNLKGYTIKGLTLSMKTNAKTGAGTVTAKVGNTQISTFNVPVIGSTYADKELTVTETAVNENEDLVITIDCTANSVYCQKFTITYDVTIDDTKTDPALSFPVETVNATLGIPFASPTLTNEYGVSLTWNSSDRSVATVENGIVALVGEGVAVITASHEQDETYNMSSASYTLVVTDPTFSVIWSEDFSAFASNSTPESGENATYSYTGDSSIYPSDSYAGGTAPELLVKASGTFVATIDDLKDCSGTMYLNFLTNGTNLSVSVKADNKSVTVTGDIVKGSNSLSFIVPSTAESIAITFSATKNSRVDNIVLKGKPTVQTVTVTEAGYATYCSAFALDFTDTGITPYVGTRSGDNLTFTPITEVPAGVAVLLASSGKTTKKVNIIESAEDVSSCLIGVLSETTITADDYILNMKDGKPGFYPAGTHTALGAHKAYIPAAAGVKGFAIDLDGNETAIEAIKAMNGNAPVYNLAGQRVQKAQKGIFIQNGRKFIVK